MTKEHDAVTEIRDEPTKIRDAPPEIIDEMPREPAEVTDQDVNRIESRVTWRS
jgi:hypothetical protein